MVESDNPPQLRRSVSSVSHDALKELAEECVCPISQSLMVDPVIASDGHTYDRSQIEHWIRQKTEANAPVTSPQTREPLDDDRLVSNLALKRTIERLVASGRLDTEIVADWQAAKASAAGAVNDAKRTKSLSNAPIGTRIVMDTKFVLKDIDPVEEVAIVDGSTALSTLRGDLHSCKVNQGGGGLFGGGAGSNDPGRVLLADVSIDAVACALVTESVEEGRRRPLKPEKLRRILQPREELAAAPLPADVLLASVIPAPEDSNGSFGGPSRGELAQQGVVSALEHIVRRLATIENALPAAVQSEWQILDVELQRRHRKDKISELRHALQGHLKIACVVDAVDNTGAFTLSFPDMELPQSNGYEARGAVPTCQVPATFIGPGAVVVESAEAQRGLFGAPRAGLFGQARATAFGAAAAEPDEDMSPPSDDEGRPRFTQGEMPPGDGLFRDAPAFGRTTVFGDAPASGGLFGGAPASGGLFGS